METNPNETAIVIITYNIANLICKQVECIRKFCKDKFDVVIIDNSDKPEVIEAIQFYNSSLGCLYHKTQSASSDSSDSHTFACNFAYEKLKDKYEYFAFIDHDMFPVKDFSIKEILGDKIMAGIGQEKTKKYIWPGCLLFNNKKIEPGLIDFSTNQELKLDTGGNLYKVIEKYGEDNCIFFNEIYHQNPYFSKNRYNYYALINDEMFLHFVNASNWANTSDHEERINSLINILNEKVQNKYAAVIIYHRNVYTRYEKEWVDACIQSIRNQSYKEYTVYELNYGEDNTRLYDGSVFEQKPMRNFIHAMNYLLDKAFAIGHKACFNINIDDFYFPDRFAMQIAEVEKGAELVSSDFRRIGLVEEDCIFHEENIKDEFAKSPPRNILCHPVICYTPQFWNKYGPYNVDSVKFEDLELWQKAVNGGAKIHIVPEILATQRIHDNNVGTKGEIHEKQTNEQPSAANTPS